MTTYNIGTGGAENASVLTGQSISGASVGQTVYFDGSSWQLATYTDWSDHTPAPQGVMSASGTVVTFGLCSGLSGLTAGSYYYISSTGDLSTTSGSVKIGVAISTTELLVDIDASTSDDYPNIVLSTIPGAYIISGEITASASTVDKFIFSDETVTNIGEKISINKRMGCGVASTEAGYTIGGMGGNPSTSLISTVDKLLFYGDIPSVISATFTPERWGTAGVASSSTGYIAAGYTTTYTSIITKLLFSTESFSTSIATLSTSDYGRGTAVTTSYGYIISGALYSLIDRLAFSTDSRYTLSAYLSSQRSEMGCFSSSTAGYQTGGYYSGGYYNLITKLLFSSETTSTLSATLSGYKSGQCGFTNTTSGYTAGGNYGSSVIDKLLFSNDTNSSISTTLPSDRNRSECFYNLG